MNRRQAQDILLLYRPSMADGDLPQVQEALALANDDPELAGWLQNHCAVQGVIRAKFRHIAAPDGLKEQIISEHVAALRRNHSRDKFAAITATIAILMSLIVLAPFWQRHSATADNTVANYKNQMVGLALRAYDMGLATNSLSEIRAYLAKNGAPANYRLPAGLRKLTVTGCAIEDRQNNKVSMICFRTGKPLPPGQQNDLWLFVTDRTALKDALPPGSPKITAVNRLITAIWTQGGQVYLLATEGNPQTIQQFL